MKLKKSSAEVISAFYGSHPLSHGVPCDSPAKLDEINIV